LLKEHGRELVRKSFMKTKMDGEALFLGDTHKDGVEI
jgi:hypothetical protein